MMRTSNSGTSSTKAGRSRWPTAKCRLSASRSPSSLPATAISPRMPRRWSRWTTTFCRRRPIAGPRSARPPVRRELKSNKVIAYKVGFGDAEAAFAKAAHVVARRSSGFIAAPRIRSKAAASWCKSPTARRKCGPRPRRRTICATRSPTTSISTKAGCVWRRRMSAAVSGRSFAFIPRTSRRGRRGDVAAPLGQMDRGSPRAFHQRGAGARPVSGRSRLPPKRTAASAACAAGSSTTSAPMRCRT